MATGEINGWTARLIVGQCSHLDRATRSRLDAELAGKSLGSMGAKQAEATAKRLAYEADPAAATERARKARKDRRVTLRPAPDTMSLLTGLLPVEQGVACYAALDAAAKHAKPPETSARGVRSWPTSWSPGSASSSRLTRANGRGMCERGNYVRELPGWTVRLVDTDSHTVEITTPTGHHYRSRPPQPP